MIKRDSESRLQKVMEKTQIMRNQARCLEVLQKFHYKSNSPHSDIRESSHVLEKPINYPLDSIKPNFHKHLVPLQDSTQDDSEKIKKLRKCLSDKTKDKKQRVVSVNVRRSERFEKKNIILIEENTKLVFFGCESPGNYRAEMRYQENKSRESVVELGE
ncbi:hypothetical protein SteCoe_13278 [Stentor coeruleus]|uniref:Uncharacterized protein n=1 Tax=Stentor coeruleus TaxID=5963 RepID=A0A1R2C8Z7_9CILI|nr:hypothetical protein SteCoe_13278 [Stentor coeruleus]